MPIRPPEPTTNRLPTSEASTQRHAALVPVILGLLLVLILAGALTWKRSLKILVVPYQVPQLTGHSPDDAYIDGGLSDHHATSQGVLTQGVGGNSQDVQGPVMVENYLRTDSGDTQLETEPADLPIPPDGQRIAGILRNQGPHQEEIAQWIVPGKHIAHILEFYREAAQQQNFQELPMATTSQDMAQGMRRNIIMTRTLRPGMNEKDKLPQGNDILIIRARQIEPDRVHVTLWYRYNAAGNRIR